LADALQKDDYYPFGLRSSLAAGDNHYLYNGKELQDEFNQYDYGARFYNPAIARWTGVDPHAESYQEWTPYSYVADNPVLLTDPNGMDYFWYSADGKSDPQWIWHEGSTYDTGKKDEYGRNIVLQGKPFNPDDYSDFDDFDGDSDEQTSANAGYNPYQGGSLNISQDASQGGPGDPFQQQQPKPGFNIPAAISALNANARSASCGACALYVRKAIQAGGINTSSHPGSAKDYGPFLTKWGFHSVTSNINDGNYSPMPGDIAVFMGFGNNIHGSWNGHIEMFNGTQWISDFRQNYFTPGPGYRKPPDPYTIYRW
jgi:RHS repeat-associated protein